MKKNKSIEKMMQERFQKYETGPLLNITKLSLFLESQIKQNFKSYKKTIVNSIVKVRIVLQDERP